MTNANMIDVDGLTSAAIVKLADSQDRLAKLQAAAVRQAADHALTQNKAQLTDALRADMERGRIRKVTVTGKESKTTLVDLAGDLYGEASDAGVELRRLQLAAGADQQMARYLNNIVREAEVAREKLAGARRDGADPTVHDVAYAMQWTGDSFMVSTVAARYVGHVERAVADGWDIRAVCLHLYQDAMRAVVSLPRHLLSNGLAGVGRGERLYEAAGAELFANLVARAYGYLDGDDLAIKLGDLN